ncbi:hypothetical protein [Synechococcus sp. MU1642]|uniref:hypothetical protein n=1 Tax=Synechococcus sp. MU1642 TaxID=2508348 RepID=UPI001CF8C275|nr:hypothetical protein [Synechococcus sp. MU1642]MCB4406594.1 hypothetical protein [Synechococcus sp. MU1642]
MADLAGRRVPPSGFSVRIEFVFPGSAACLGGRHDHRPLTVEKGGTPRLRLQERPDRLVRLGWLGPGWPRVIGNASQLELEMTALPMQKQPGGLRLQLEVP